MYREGQGVVQDHVKAMEWFLKAAKDGHAASQRQVGSMYYRGQGVDQEYSKTVEWMLRAADQGLALAQRTVGRFYNEGFGVPQNHSMANKVSNRIMPRPLGGTSRQLVKKMQDCSSGSARCSMTVLESSKQDYRAAAEWYLKAANQGHAMAQNNLGALYHQGRGVPLDQAKAIDWYLKAANQGSAQARDISQICTHAATKVDLATEATD
ncbi:hypothetical protein BGX29_007236 [Mortierella sp. GBA35]|nr:hypothetical protein BGX23_003801 [Mortierella sp. AD031]KAF9099254.1 hypothetical protein BGX29_007236 [Mortierella sp. GBA35]KAG0214261.1 hypothetical protein BGX33_002283 [Mortierella sp. NVP41]